MAIFRRPAGAYPAEVNRAVAHAFVDRLMTLAGDAAMPQVRAIATSRLRRIAARLKAAPPIGDAQTAHAALLQDDIARFLARPHPPAETAATPTAPPGAPIGASTAWGSADDDWCGLQPAGRPPFFPPLSRAPTVTPGAVASGTAGPAPSPTIAVIAAADAAPAGGCGRARWAEC